MQATRRKIINELHDVRHRLGELERGDVEALIPIGASLEALFAEIPAADDLAVGSLTVSLQALQAIFESKDDGQVIAPVLLATLTALEHYFGSGANPIAIEMLKHTVSKLSEEIHVEPGGYTSEGEPKKEQDQTLYTLEDVGEFMAFVDPHDKPSMLLIFDALREIADRQISSVARKVIVKAAREIESIIKAEAIDLHETLDTVKQFIDSTNEIHRTFAPNAADEPDENIHGTELPGWAEREDRKSAGPREFAPDILGDDADLDLFGEFIVESREMLETAEGAMLELENDPENLDHINTIFRAFHTIKGSAAYLGQARLSSLAHLAESLLSRTREKEIRCTGGYANLSLQSIDLLKEMFDRLNARLDGGELTLPDSYANLFETLTDPESAGISESAATQMGSVSSDRSEDETTKKQTPSDASVRVRTDRLDQLIDMVGELVIAQSMLAQDEAALQATHPDVSRKIAHAGKIVRDLQDLSMGMRMVPLRATFQKMSRLVRDLANKTSKEIDLTTRGEDTEIDRNMVDLVADPLVHMVRNAVDHGVETPERRLAAGKSRNGALRLSAYHSGGDVIIELKDDGAGIDKDAVIAKAIANGLIDSDKGMTDDQIFNLIFAPGFSTAAKVTDVSGRGVGMDVVRRNIEQMRGRVQIASEKGSGTTFTVRLPLTLAITDGMLVRVGSERFIIPIVNIHLSFRPNAGMITNVAGRGELVSLRGELMPVFRLHQLFDVVGAADDPTDGLMMIVADGRRRCALFVDELLGQQQVVAKNLGQGLGKIPGVSGGAILGDGRVGMILDTAELVALARETGSSSIRKIQLPSQQAA